MASGPITSWEIDGETMESVTDLTFGGTKITADGDCSDEIKRCLLLERKGMTNLDSTLKSKDIPLPTKVHLVKAMVCSVVIYGCESLDYKVWAPKNWCFWTAVLEKTLESPLDSKEMQPVLKDINLGVHWKDWYWSWTPVLWWPDVKSWLIWKDPDAGKDWGKEKGTTEDKMVGWHHWLNGLQFGWTLGVGDGQGGLVCCGSWGHKELDTTEQLNWTEPSMRWQLLHIIYP